MENNRITLQYSVEESQLKYEVHRLVSNAIERLTSIACETPPVNTILTLSTVDEIANLRTELAKIDILFADASGIIESYVDYKHQQRASSPNADPADPLNLESLQKKMQNFKQKLDINENSDQRP